MGREGTARDACHFQSSAFRGQRFSTWRTIIYHGPWPSSECVCVAMTSAAIATTVQTHTQTYTYSRTPPLTHTHTHSNSRVTVCQTDTPQSRQQKLFTFFSRFFVNLAQLKNVDASFCVIVNRLFCMHAELYIINYSMSVHTRVV